MIHGHWRAIAAALFVLILVAGASVAGDHPDPQPTVRVPVSIQSHPDYADIYLNGKFVGSTSIEQRLTPGVHVIEIRRDGYSSWRRELTVTAGNPTRVVALLDKKEK